MKNKPAKQMIHEVTGSRRIRLFFICGKFYRYKGSSVISVKANEL